MNRCSGLAKILIVCEIIKNEGGLCLDKVMISSLRQRSYRYEAEGLFVYEGAKKHEIDPKIIYS